MYLTKKPATLCKNGGTVEFDVAPLTEIQGFTIGTGEVCVVVPAGVWHVPAQEGIFAQIMQEGVMSVLRAVGGSLAWDLWYPYTNRPDKMLSAFGSPEVEGALYAYYCG